MRINALGNIATDFASDDYIALDGTTNGSRKLPAKLLAIMFEFHPHIGYLKDDGTFSTSNTVHCLYTDKTAAAEGDIFFYRGVGRSSAYSVLFFNSSGSVISGLQYNSANTYVEVTCPASTAYVQFSSFADAADEIVLSVIKKDSQLYGLFEDGNKLSAILDKVSGWSDGLSKQSFAFYPHVGFLKDDGTFSTANTVHCLYTDKIEASAGDKFMYRGDGHSSAYSVLVYNSSGSIISALQYNTPNTYVEVTCPANTAYVQFSSFISVSYDVPLSVIKKDSQLYGLLNEILDLSVVANAASSKVTSLASESFPFIPHVGFLKDDGTFTTATTVHCLYTDKIAAAENDVFLYRGVGRSSAYSVLVYNSSGSIISALQYNTPDDCVEVTCPASTAYVQFSSFANAADEIVLSVIKKDSQLYGAVKYSIYASKDDVLRGKVWYSCGDSFTEGSAETGDPIADGPYKGKNPVYPYLIGTRTLCDVRNIAKSGASLAQPSDQSDTNVFTRTTTGKLYTTDFSDADIITLYFGINDSHNDVPIGTIDDADNSTFYGAWNVTLDYLTANYPAAKIGLIISNGCETADYPNATKAIAEKWGVAFLDLDGGIGCQTMLRCSSRNPASATIKTRRLEQQRISVSNTHPNALGHLLESTFIEAWIKSL